MELNVGEVDVGGNARRMKVCFVVIRSVGVVEGVSRNVSVIVTVAVSQLRSRWLLNFSPQF